MSCFSSFMNCPMDKDFNHNWDFAINVIHQNEVRVACHKCDKTFYIKITKKKYKELCEGAK